MLVKVCYQAFHWPLALLSTILACLSSISWLRTIFLMPTKILPRELPPNYDLSDETLIASCKRRGTIDEIDHRELQECLEKCKTRLFSRLHLFVIYNRRNRGPRRGVKTLKFNGIDFKQSKRRDRIEMNLKSGRMAKRQWKKNQ